MNKIFYTEQNFKANTEGAGIPKIQIQNLFEIWMFPCLDLGWFGIIIIGTNTTAMAVVATVVYRYALAYP